MWLDDDMTTTTATNTDTLIASANTDGGFAIGIVRAISYTTGKYFYRVVRLDPQSRYVTITVHATEEQARKSANIEYRAEMAAIRKGVK